MLQPCRRNGQEQYTLVWPSPKDCRTSTSHLALRTETELFKNYFSTIAKSYWRKIKCDIRDFYLNK